VSVSCEPELVTGYVDGELSPEEQARVGDHLRGCAACQQQADSERALRARIRALPEIVAPAGLEQRLRARLRAARPSPWRFVLPLAAGLVGILLWAGGSPAVVAWELSRDHDKCFGMERLPAEVFTSDGRVAAARLDLAGASLPELPQRVRGIELVGGRRCPLADRRAVHLFYAAGARRVSVFVIQGRVRLSGRYASEARANAVRLLTVSGATVGIVGESEEDVVAFERAFLETRA
jgi:anti-sigma factor RsiW